MTIFIYFMSTLVAWHTFSAANWKELRQFKMTKFAIDFNASTDNDTSEQSSDINNADINRPILRRRI